MAAVTTALVGAAVIGAGAAAYTANKNAETAKKATNAQIAAAERQQATATATNAPYVEAGENALQKIANLSGANGAEAATAARSDFTTSPGYAFRLEEGTRAIENSAAARGMGLSGAALKAGTTFAQNTAADEYSTYYNRLQQLAGIGQQAAAATTGAGNTATQQIIGATGAGAQAQMTSNSQTSAAVNNLLQNVAFGYSAYGNTGAATGGTGATIGQTGTTVNPLKPMQPAYGGVK